MNEAEMQEHFDAFFDEIYTELEDSYGEIDEMIICDNLGEHLCGNVFCMFKDEDDAFKCVKALNDRWVDGRPIQAELCPITDFRDACCRQYRKVGHDCHARASTWSVWDIFGRKIEISRIILAV